MFVEQVVAIHVDVFGLVVLGELNFSAVFHQLLHILRSEVLKGYGEV